MSKILIKDPLLVTTMNGKLEEFKGGHILSENGKISSIGPNELNIPADEIIDAANMVVVPGLINTHHHFFQTLTRNIPKTQNAPLFNWLSTNYEIWRELNEEGMYLAAKTAIAELLLSGTTTTSDHHYLFPKNTSTYLIDREIEAAKELGIRFYPTRGSMSLGKPQGGLPPADIIQSDDEIIKDTERLVKKYHEENDGAMVRIALAPCSPFNVTNEFFKYTADYAKENNLLIHTHLAETNDEEKYCLEKFGKRPLEYIESLGWLTNSAWFAHTVFLNDKEIHKMGKCSCGTSHCPSSNMRLGSGIAPIKKLLNAGVNVSLAVDGSASNDSSNMLSELRNALLLSRLLDNSDWLTAREVLWMATKGGALALNRDDIGELSTGKQADIALFSLDSIEYAGGMSDPLASLLFSVRTSPVDHLIINGKHIVNNGKLKFDVNNHIKQHNAAAEQMLNKATKNTGINFLDR